MDIKNLLGRVTDDLIRFSTSKRTGRKLFPVLAGAARVPYGKYAAQYTFASLLPRDARGMIDLRSIASAAQAGYLHVDNADNHRKNRNNLHGSLKKVTQSVYKLSEKGWNRLEELTTQLELEKPISTHTETEIDEALESIEEMISAMLKIKKMLIMHKSALSRRR